MNRTRSGPDGPVRSGAIPPELRARDQWVLWRTETRQGKPTKVPYQPRNPRRKAKANDPATWATFEEATAIEDAHGIGYVFAAEDPFTGVDLDACIDTETGELHPAASEVLEQLGGYQERSPSNSGMHAIVIGAVNGDRHRTSDTPWGGVFEIYDRLRFFTVTGNGAGTITERQSQLDAVVEEMFGKPSANGAGPANDEPGRSAEELIRKFPRLGRIARHEGKPPKDASDSGWDFWLTCEGCQRGLNDAELGAMIAYARRGDRKGARSDYVKRTIAGARKRLPAPSPLRRWIPPRRSALAGTSVRTRLSVAKRSATSRAVRRSCTWTVKVARGSGSRTSPICSRRASRRGWSPP